jgi:predicted metal-dependent peptidase
MNNNESLAKASKELMFKEPFYGIFLMSLRKTWVDNMGTAGVSKNGINFKLSIDPEFWKSLTSDWQKGILKHELLHIAFFHLTMRDSFLDKKLFNIAADIEINQYIDKSMLPCADMDYQDYLEKYKDDDNAPPRGAYLEDFDELNLNRKAGTKYYYEKLQDACKKGKGTCKALDMLMGNGEGDEASGIKTDIHPTWKEFDNLPEAEKKLIQNQTDHVLKGIAEAVNKSQGHIPGELSSYINALLNEEPPKFNWKAYVRRFTGGSIKTFTKKSRRKISKRYFGQPGLKIKKKKHILVGIDTSGSVSNDELKEFFHEIHHIFKTGCEVTVAQCDTTISSLKKYEKRDDGKIAITGRGGTAFDPVINLFNENLRDYSCLIYLTDGEATAHVKPRGRILWVLSSVSNDRYIDSLPGPVIKLN